MASRFNADFTCPVFRFKLIFGKGRILRERVGLDGVEAEEISDSEIEKLIGKRAAAKKARNFTESDRIRDSLAERGGGVGGYEGWEYEVEEAVGLVTNTKYSEVEA